MTDKDTLNYGRYMEKAMRGVMVEVLGHIARDGLPGAHYFYITFDTTHPGVDIADWLRERYPVDDWAADNLVRIQNLCPG